MRSTYPRCTLIIIFILFTLFSVFPLAKAAINITVDDQNGDESTNAMPIYSPADAWNQGASCSKCNFHLNSSSTYDSTWHDATFYPGFDPCTIQISFIGSAVYAYFILAGQQNQTTTLTNLSFALDGNDAGSLIHVPSANGTFQYNILGFSKEDLANSAHTLVISTAADTEQSLVLFDRVVYTSENATVAETASISGSSYPVTSNATSLNSVNADTLTSMSYPSSTTTQPAEISAVANVQGSSHVVSRGAIIGGSIAGGVVVLSILAIVLLCRRRRHRRGMSDIVVEPFTTERVRGLCNRPTEGFPSVISIRRSCASVQHPGSSKVGSLLVETLSLNNGERLAMPKPTFSLPTLYARRLVDKKVDPFRRRNQTALPSLPPHSDRTESLLAFPSTSIYNTSVGHLSRRPKLSVIVPGLEFNREDIGNIVRRDNEERRRSTPTSSQTHSALAPRGDSLPIIWMADKKEKRPPAEWLVRREQALLEQIATLQAEVEQLQDTPNHEAHENDASILPAYHGDLDIQRR